MKSKLRVLIENNTKGIANYGLHFAIAGVFVLYIFIQFGKNIISYKLWNVFKNEIRFLEAESSSEPEDKDSQIILASLLLEVSGVDNDYSEQEIRIASRILEQNFQINNKQAEEVLKKATYFRNEKFTIDQFLNKNYSAEEKQQLFSSIWQIMNADQKITFKENNLAIKFQKRLELPRKLAEEVKSQDRL